MVRKATLCTVSLVEKNRPQKKIRDKLREIYCKACKKVIKLSKYTQKNKNCQTKQLQHSKQLKRHFKQSSEKSSERTCEKEGDVSQASFLVI